MAAKKSVRRSKAVRSSRSKKPVARSSRRARSSSGLLKKAYPEFKDPEQALKILKSLVESGQHPTFDGPEDFSDYFCKFWLKFIRITNRLDLNYENKPGNIILQIEDAMPWRTGRGDYKKLFNKYMSIVAPHGIFAARGMSGLPIENKKDAMAIVKSLSLQDEVNYSRNIAYASASFAKLSTFVFKNYVSSYLGKPIKDQRRERALRNTKSKIKIKEMQTPEELIKKFKEYKDEYERYRKLQEMKAAEFVASSMIEHKADFTSSSVEKHGKMVLSSMLIVSKIPLKDLESFGGDSESGILQEAEIKVKPSCTFDNKCIQHVFVLCPFKLDAPKATLAERKKYCLNYYYELEVSDYFSIYTHSEFPCKGLPLFKKFKLVDNVPKTHTWYRIK